MIVYGLLHLAPGKYSAVNLKKVSFVRQIEIYFRNAITLRQSLQSNGIDFILLTNNNEFLKVNYPELSKKITIRQIDFISSVPDNKAFYSAHFKKDVFNYLANLKQEYVGFLDIDVIASGKLPSKLNLLKNSKTPILYEIPWTNFKGAEKLVESDLKFTMGFNTKPRWFGGEIIFGSPDFFKLLSQKIDSSYQNYLNNHDKISHNGDEVFVSGALCRMIDEGLSYVDAKDIKLLARYFSVLTPFKQIRFREIQNSFLLHLPSDKKLLAHLVDKKFLQNNFVLLYKLRLFWRIPRKFLTKPIIWYLKLRN